MAHVSHKLKNALQGALAGGGDPATSPLYVFGPFLKLLVVSSATAVVFGTAIWMAVLTVAVVAFMYRYVMLWVTDGSGGSGLNEEEFGPWAVKVNASITIIEYTLTFLVSVAALVTFLSDRFPSLSQEVLGVSGKTIVAVVLTVVTGVVVNRGPSLSATVFGPATAAVLLLLWVLIFVTIGRFGFSLPGFDLNAFSQEHLPTTLGGYARILALMTGIEIFANLVAAYDGTARQKSRKAFVSLCLVMVTTALTMLVVGPAIRDLSDPMNPGVSVFTQTMDKLLPAQLAYLGTLVGIAVLLSAAAASAQGVQNLCLGLRYRHYLPAPFARKNKSGVSSAPVWLLVVVVTGCFAGFGTHEETYLALYAAGVFVLLTLTGWAVVKRLLRQALEGRSVGAALACFGAVLGSILTTCAAGIIIEERFFEGAWMYLVLVPALYGLFGRFRQRLGAPQVIEDRLGRLVGSSYLSPKQSDVLYTGAELKRILVPLDSTAQSEQGLTIVRTLARESGSGVCFLHVQSELNPKDNAIEDYFRSLSKEMIDDGISATWKIASGDPSTEIAREASSGEYDLTVFTTRGSAFLGKWLNQSITHKVLVRTTPPVLVVRPTGAWKSLRTRFTKVLVALDGSETAEEVLPHVQSIAIQYKSEVTLFSAPVGNESEAFSGKLETYLNRIAGDLEAKGIRATALVPGKEASSPAQAILDAAKGINADTIMLVTHGNGGSKRSEYVKVGSVADRVIREAECPVYVVSAGSALLSEKN